MQSADQLVVRKVSSHGDVLTFIIVVIITCFSKCVFVWMLEYDITSIYPANTGCKKNVFLTVEKPYKPPNNVFKMFFLCLVFAGHYILYHEITAPIIFGKMHSLLISENWFFSRNEI